MQIHSVQNTGARQPVESQSHGVGCPCPACKPSGGGGGGGGGKSNVSGLMNWNQAWAVWNALQTANARKSDYLKGFENNLLFQQQQTFTATQKSSQVAAFARFIQAVFPQAQNISRVISNMAQSVSRFGQSLRSPINMIQAAFQNINIADKLATLLGNSKTLLDDLLQQNVEGFKHLLARFQFAERLAQVNRMMEKAFQILASEAAQWVQKAEEQVQRLAERFRRWLMGEPPSKKKKRD